MLAHGAAQQRRVHEAAAERGVRARPGVGDPRWLEDDVVVGEIGGGFVAPGLVEIGYAIVPSCWGLGYATEAVRALVERARAIAELDHEHDGAVMRVKRWELALG